MKMLVPVELDGELYEKLRESAKSQDRSISQQTTHILRAYLEMRRGGDGAERDVATRPARGGDMPEARTERLERVFAHIDSLPGLADDEDLPSPAEVVREMREERDGQIAPDLGSGR